MPRAGVWLLCAALSDGNENAFRRFEVFEADMRQLAQSIRAIPAQKPGRSPG